MKPLFALIASVLAVPAAAQDTPLELRDMVGARAGQAEGELQRRGYRNVGGEKGDDRSYAYWWNAERQRCVTVATMDGRYDSITTSPKPDCQQRVSGREGNRNSERGRDRRGSGIAAPYELSQICRDEAAARWDRRPSELTVNAPIQQRTGAITQGWFQDGDRTKFFNCRFDENGRFLGVN